MTGIEWAVFWLAWCLAGGSPGPATMAIAGTAMQRGRKYSLSIALGILLGSATWGVAAALGISALMLANAWMFEVLRYLGAGYLLLLAFKSLRSALGQTQTLQERAVGGGAGTVFWKGALLHLTNPKAILSWGAVYSLVLPNDAATTDLLSLFAFLYSGSILVFIGYAFMFSTAPLVLAYKRARRIFELTFAAFFGAASLKILTARFVE
ncbi:MAG: LysE family translocator [Planktomarina sp.]